MFYDRDGKEISEEAWKSLWENEDYRILNRTEIGPWEIVSWWTGVDERGGTTPKIYRSGLVSHPKDGVPVKDTYRGLLQQFHHATITEALAKHDELVARMAGDDIDHFTALSSTSCSMSQAEPAAVAAEGESGSGGCHCH
jgi:hypothetical protein